MKPSYVYWVLDTENDMEYYGSRTVPKSGMLPEEDLGITYFTSSDILRPLFKENPSRFKTKIIGVFENRKDADELEIELHSRFDVKNNVKFYNQSNSTHSGFSFESKRFHTDEKYKTKKQKWLESHRTECFRKQTSNDVKERWAKDKNYRDTIVEYRNTEEYRKQQSKNTKNQWKNEEFRKYMLDVVAKRPEVIAIRQNVFKECWKTESFRKSHKESMNRPETKEKLSKQFLGRKKIFKDGVTKNVKPEELNIYIADGWTIGSGKDSSIKGRKAMNKDGKVKYIKPQDVQTYIENGWSMGNYRL